MKRARMQTRNMNAPKVTFENSNMSNRRSTPSQMSTILSSKMKHHSTTSISEKERSIVNLSKVNLVNGGAKAIGLF